MSHFRAGRALVGRQVDHFRNGMQALRDEQENRVCSRRATDFGESRALTASAPEVR